MKQGIFALSVLLMAPAVWAQPTYQCTKAQFAGEPEIKSGIYTASMYSDCVVTGADGKGLKDLEAQQLRDTAQAGKINQGPISETFLGLPSTYFDITVSVKDPNGSGEIRNDIHIATDSARRFLFSSVSKSITLSGMAGFLKKIEILFEVNPTQTPGRYSVKLTNTVHVAKPAAAPELIFKPIARKSALDQFSKNRDQLLPSIANAL
jgi:hypothetical protein